MIVAQGLGPLLFARENRALFGDPPIVTRITPLGQMVDTDKITGLQGGYWVTAQSIWGWHCCRTREM